MEGLLNGPKKKLTQKNYKEVEKDQKETHTDYKEPQNEHRQMLNIHRRRQMTTKNNCRKTKQP